VALVPAEQLGGLGGAEQDDDRRDRAGVRVVADRHLGRELVPDLFTGRELGEEGQGSDDQDRRQEGQDPEDDRGDLRPTATAEPERGSEAVDEEGPDRVARPSRGPS
jgi:hypothetical protein